MKRKKLRLAAAIAGAIVLLVAAISAYRHPYFRRRRTEGLIRAYAGAPDMAKAARLVAALKKGHADLDQGRRILVLLTTPKVTVRSAYRADRQVGYRVALPEAAALLTELHPYPRSVSMGGLSGWSGESLTRSVEIRLRGSDGERSVHSDEPILWGNPPHKEGVYRIDGKCLSRYASEITRLGVAWPSNRQFPMNLLPEWRDVPIDEQIIYEGEVPVMIELRVVAPAEAEHIELVAGPEIDRRMRRAISWQPDPVVFRAGDPNFLSGNNRAVLDYRDLPVCWSAQTWYVDPEGVRVGLPQGAVLARAGTSGTINIPLFMGYFEPPGSRGKLLLKPDAALIYHDPAVKAIWSGTVEIPLTFAAGGFSPRSQPAGSTTAAK